MIRRALLAASVPLALVVGGTLLSTLPACGIAQPKHIGPSQADYQHTLAVVDSNMLVLRGDLEKMRDEDLAQKKPRHGPEWWAMEIGLTMDTASIASTIGHK